MLLSFQKLVAQVGLQNLKCEMLQNPLGIDVVQPRLSWEIVSKDRNVEQKAFQIIVASTAEKLAANEGDLWNSDKVNSPESIHVKYSGKALTSRMRCFWLLGFCSDCRNSIHER